MDQFKDLMTIIFLIAAALSLILEGSHGLEMWTVILLAAASVVLYVEIGKFIIRATGWDEKFDAGSELNK